MRVYTDSREFAREVFPHVRDWSPAPPPDALRPASLGNLAARMFGTRAVFLGRDAKGPRGLTALCVASSPVSQFDLVVELGGSPEALPHGVVCLAGTGRGFHGQRGRSWVAETGNLHLTIHWRPERPLSDLGIGFPVLAAVSVVECLDSLPGLSKRPGIKWVNDILLGPAKVAGFITHIQSQDGVVRAAVLGIGLNIQVTPHVEPSPQVPVVTSLAASLSCTAASCSQDVVLHLLLARLEANYLKLCRGRSRELLGLYRDRSVIIGRHVRILSDPPEGGPETEIASGRVYRIGDGLELYIEGRERPVPRGRLILLD